MENVKQKYTPKIIDILAYQQTITNQGNNYTGEKDWALNKIVELIDLAIAERDREVVEMINKFIEEAYFHAESSGWSANNLRTGEPIKDFHTPSYNRGLDESKKIINLINSKK